MVTDCTEFTECTAAPRGATGLAPELDRCAVHKESGLVVSGAGARVNSARDSR